MPGRWGIARHASRRRRGAGGRVGPGAGGDGAGRRRHRRRTVLPREQRHRADGHRGGAWPRLASVAAGLARARRWSRTPALLTQLFVGIVGIYLLQGHRLDWGVALVVLAVAGFAAAARHRPACAPWPAGEQAQPDAAAQTGRQAQPGPTRTGAGGSLRPSAGRVRRGRTDANRRRSAPPGAGRASWPAAGTRASGRCRVHWRSVTGSCCRRSAAAGSAFPGAAAAPAAA